MAAILQAISPHSEEMTLKEMLMKLINLIRYSFSTGLGVIISDAFIGFKEKLLFVALSSFIIQVIFSNLLIV